MLVPEQKESIFTYYDINNNVALSLGSDVTGTKMVVGGVECSIESIMSTTVFTSTMKPFCVLWTSSNGRVAVYFNNEFWAKTCASSTGLSVAAGGVFQLGGEEFYHLSFYRRPIKLLFQVYIVVL